MRNLLLLFLCGFPFFGFAQGAFNIPKHQIGISYFGETLLHPGVVLSYDHSWKSFLIEKTSKKGKVKDKLYSLEYGVRVGGYNFTRNHTGLFLAPILTMTRTTPKGSFYRMGFQAGGIAKILNAPVFDLANSTSSPGMQDRYLYFMGGFRLGVGKDLSVKHPKLPLKWQLGSSLFFTHPFSSSQLWQNAIELGLTWKIG
ncbi:MAG: hypothetical protein KDC34_20615 [Saprospiraceae bacterium]|nr:hypothetical protein [Saprospiraceae bacterium]